MSEHLIDARELPCPQPVIMTKKHLDDETIYQIRILVDDKVQAENVASMAKNNGWNAKLDVVLEEHVELVISRPETETTATAETDEQGASCIKPSNIFLMITSDKLGQGSDELGEILIRGYLKTLFETIPHPSKIAFLNSGVRLTCAGSVVIDDLKRLEESGVEIMSCGTCLDYFDIKDQLAIGKISNMFEIADAMTSADKVINL